jgi:hypothetical protein
MFYSSDGLSLSIDKATAKDCGSRLGTKHYCDWLICLLAEFKLRKNSKKALNQHVLTITTNLTSDNTVISLN